MSPPRRRARDAGAFPWREGNRIALLVDGDAFFAAMQTAIRGASTHVDLMIYLFESGECATGLIDEFCAAAARGVRVRLLLDGFGTLGLGSAERNKLQRAGAQIAEFNPLEPGKWLRNLFRDHRKLLVADRRKAFIGGFGYCDEFDPRFSGRDAWHDIALQVQGPVLQDINALFDLEFTHWSSETVHDAPGNATSPSGAAATRLVANRPPWHRRIYRNALERIDGDRGHLWMATGYFAPALRLRRALRRAAREGADVRLLLPGPKTDRPAVRLAAWRHYGGLLRAGVRIYEYQPRCLHLKALLCDDWLSAGSCNLDHWGARWNHDLNLEVRCPELAAELRALFAKNFSLSQEISLEQYLSRPFWRRWLQHLLAWVSLQVQRASHRRELRRRRD